MDYTKVSYTTTATAYAKPEWIVSEIFRYVRHTKSADDAVINLHRILKEYEKRKPFRERLARLFFNF